MKKTILFALITIALYACGSKGNDPSPTDPHFGAWSVKSITRDGVDYTSLYSKTKLTISAGTYNITNLPSPTPFMSTGTTTSAGLQQGDGLVFTYVDISNKEMKFNFIFSGAGYPGGRVTGQWNVDLVKQ